MIIITKNKDKNMLILIEISFTEKNKNNWHKKGKMLKRKKLKRSRESVEIL